MQGEAAMTSLHHLPGGLGWSWSSSPESLALKQEALLPSSAEVGTMSGWAR